MKSGVECDSSDSRLENVWSVAECANQCHAMKDSCKFFIVGNGLYTEISEERCYVEHTSDSSCPEGWDSDSYDFYEMKGNYDI